VHELTYFHCHKQCGGGEKWAMGLSEVEDIERGPEADIENRLILATPQIVRVLNSPNILYF
jgi:hypothetical protein